VCAWPVSGLTIIRYTQSQQTGKQGTINVRENRRLDNPEKLATFGTQDTGQRQTYNPGARVVKRNGLNRIVSWADIT
jgi:hypothetical protein